MDADALKLSRLTERALRDGGSLPLSLLLETLVPLRRLRALAQEFGVSPKGFRVERAPARTLAPLLAELREPGQIDRVMGLLLGAMPAAAGAAIDATDGGGDDEADAAEADAAPPIDHVAARRFLEQELAQARVELERARLSAVRAQEREALVRQAAERDAAQVQQLRGELERARRVPTGEPDAGAADRELSRRVHELEQDLAARDEADAALRRQLAGDRARQKELEDEVAELEEMVPKGRRRKVPPAEPQLPRERRFLLPWFAPSFYRSLDGKDRRAIERALHAILVFCTEGHAYPGLDVKHLGGQDTWSLRASLGLRVYFRHRDDGDVEFLELADREEQNTTLRRLKDR